MSTGSDSPARERPAEERAEELMERFVSDASRVVRRVLGRSREELEDIVAEAKEIHQRGRTAG